MNKNENIVREPLFHVAKRSKGNDSFIRTVITKLAAIFIALTLSCIMCAILAKTNPINIFKSLIDGCFGSKRRIWVLFRDIALLLGVSLAIAPAFKMKFWNLGGNGQVLIGALATIACMFYLGGKLPDPVVNVIMVIAGISAGIIWAVIPAIFKAFFNTNESLFTLMLNYIAEGLVAYALTVWVKSGSGTLNTISVANLPKLGNDHLLTIIVVAVVTAIMTVYLKFHKQGYEISVVGESKNTARYIGINVKWVTIRTLIISGAICGLIGMLLSGSINHTITTSVANNMGFTAIMTAWLAKFDPLMMIVSCFFITFLTKGTQQVRIDFHFTNTSLTDIIVAIIYFFVIASDFFINYKIIFRNKKEKGEKVKKEVKG